MLHHFLPPRPKRFARTMRRAAVRVAGDRPVRLDEAGFYIQIGPEDSGLVVHLDNAYAEYVRSKPWRRQAVVDHYVASIIVTPLTRKDRDLTLDDALPNLLPRVRDNAWYFTTALLPLLHGGKEPMSLPRRRLNDHLSVELVIDFPTSVQMVSAPVLADWGKTLDDLLPHATDNLWKRSNERWEVLRPGLYRSPWRDTHDASRLFLHDLVWQLEVSGDHVACIPDRDTLLVTGLDDHEGLQAMSELALEFLKGERYVTAVPFVLRGREWQALTLPQDHPCHEAVRRMHLASHVRACAGQKEILDRVHEKQSVDQFVASCELLCDNTTGRWFTYAVWAGDLDELLPKVDQIAFADGEPPNIRDHGFAPWERVVEVMGDAMQPQGMEPERWRIQKFPTPEQLQRIAPQR